MEGEHHGYAAFFRGEDQRRGQVVQVTDMDNVGLMLIQKFGERAIHLPVAVTVAGAGHVDDVQRNQRVRGVCLALHRILRQEGVLLTGENVHLVAVRNAWHRPWV